MPVIALFSGTHCHGEELAGQVAINLGYRVINDRDLIAETSKRFQLDESKLGRALFSKPSIFNKFTHEKERALACLKSVLANLVGQDRQVFFGHSCHLIPRDIAHVLRVGVIADMKYRVAQLMGKEGVSEKEALKRLHRDDENIATWIDTCFSAKDPWSVDFYDIIIPMDKSTVLDAAGLIVDNAGKEVLKVTDSSMRAVEDFRLATQVELVLTKEGHQVGCHRQGCRSHPHHQQTCVETGRSGRRAQEDRRGCCRGQGSRNQGWPWLLSDRHLSQVRLRGAFQSAFGR